MRKICCLSIIAILFNTALFAQKWYGRIALGYATPAASQTFDVFGNPYNGNVTYSPTNDSISSYSIKKASFSSGLKGAIGLGYSVNNHIAFELNADLGLASTKYTTSTQNSNTPSVAYLTNNTLTQYAQFPVMLIPSAVYKTDKPKLNLYGKVGIVMPLHNQVSVDLVRDYISAVINEEEIKGTLKTRFNMGFAGTAGLSYMAAKGVRFFAEFNFMSMSLYAKEMKITQHTGATNPNVPPIEGSTITYGYSGKASATEQPTFSIPYSNMGLYAGLAFDIK
jgi:hypothetical protein